MLQYCILNSIAHLFKTTYGSDSKESTCNAGATGSIPVSGRFPWRWAWQPTPVFLPRESPWTEKPGRGHKESDMTEAT